MNIFKPATVDDIKKRNKTVVLNLLRSMYQKCPSIKNNETTIKRLSTICIIRHLSDDNLISAKSYQIPWWNGDIDYIVRFVFALNSIQTLVITIDDITGNIRSFKDNCNPYTHKLINE